MPLISRLVGAYFLLLSLIELDIARVIAVSACICRLLATERSLIRLKFVHADGGFFWNRVVSLTILVCNKGLRRDYHVFLPFFMIGVSLKRQDQVT